MSYIFNLSRADHSAFLAARQREQQQFDSVARGLKGLGFFLVGENLMWQRGRQWEQHELVSQKDKSIYYEVLPGVEVTAYCRGYFTLAELQMCLQGEGPAVRDSQEFMALEALRPRRGEEKVVGVRRECASP